LRFHALVRPRDGERVAWVSLRAKADRVILS
jgi:hypothetical protein